MKTVDLDTVVTKPEVIRELTDGQMLLSYAIFDVMQYRLWEYANKHDAFHDPKWKERDAQVTTHMDIIKAEHIAKFPEQWFVWEFRANTQDAKFIEGMLAANFGTEGMEYSSSNDFLSFDTSDDRKEIVEGFMKANFPNLDFSTEPVDTSEQDIPSIVNWNVSEELVNAAGIKVIVKMPELTKKPDAVIATLMETAVDALEKTGLSRTDAIEVLAFKMGVMINGTLDNL